MFEELVLELIEFLQKWGLWRDVIILSQGKKYAHTSDNKQKYKGFSNVEFSEGEKHKDYTSGLTGSGFVSFANPEYLLDMVYEGPLCTLLRYDEYETRVCDISKEGWDYIFAHPDIIEEYIFSKYDEEDFEEDDMYTKWDPLVFDNWDEYKKLRLHEEYEASLNHDNSKVWARMVEQARKDLNSDNDELISLPQLRGYLISEFDKIFEKYGLWYDFGFSWSLTCYKD